MVTLEARVSRLEGVVEQMNERLGAIETGVRDIQADLRNKADKWEGRLWSGLLGGLLAAILAAVLVKL